MKKTAELFCLATATLLLSGCEVSHEIDLAEQSSLKLVVYGEAVNGITQANTRELKETDPQFRQVIDWLTRNRDGWDNYVATPAMGGALVSGTGFTMIIRDESVLVTFRDSSGDPRQLIRQLSTPELAFLYGE
ncbi:MAG: hypothetical protein WBF93_00770 [Pirellulales bacterium]